MHIHLSCCCRYIKAEDLTEHNRWSGPIPESRLSLKTDPFVWFLSVLVNIELKNLKVSLISRWTNFVFSLNLFSGTGPCYEMKPRTTSRWSSAHLVQVNQFTLWHWFALSHRKNTYLVLQGSIPCRRPVLAKIVGLSSWSEENEGKNCPCFRGTDELNSNVGHVWFQTVYMKIEFKLADLLISGWTNSEFWLHLLSGTCTRFVQSACVDWLEAFVRCHKYGAKWPDCCHMTWAWTNVSTLMEERMKVF